MPLSTTAVREVLAAEGFAPLPRRLDEERPARIGPNVEAIANVNDFALGPREFSTRTGGLFLFIPDLVRLDSDAVAHAAQLPGSRMIPAAHALRASLAHKLWAIERKSHIMALVADEGLALFCGLNAMPKKSFLSEYSSRVTPQKISRLLARLACPSRWRPFIRRSVAQSRLPLRAILWRAPTGQTPLFAKAKPPPAQYPDLPGPGCR